MPLSPQEKHRRNKIRRRNKHLQEVGPVPLCACGCGQEVSVYAKNRTPTRIAGHGGVPNSGLPIDAWKREDFKEVVDHIRQTNNLSIRDYCEIIGVSKSLFSATLFKKAKWVRPETVDVFLRPFAFGSYYPPVKRMTQAEGSKIRWTDPDGYEDFEPLRQQMLELKEELGTNWVRLAAYFGINRSVLHLYFTNPDHKRVSHEKARFWGREIRMIRSLPQSRKEEAFTPKKRSEVTQPWGDARRIATYLHTIKKSGDFRWWKDVAEATGIDVGRIGRTLRSKSGLIRVSVYEEMEAACKEWLVKNETRRLQVAKDQNRLHSKTKEVDPIRRKRRSAKRIEAKKKVEREQEDANRVQREKVAKALRERATPKMSMRVRGVRQTELEE